MSYDANTANTDAAGFRNKFNHDGDYLGWARAPGFNPLKLLAVVVGFAIFPPLGVAALVYFIWNARRHRWHGWRGKAMSEGFSCGRGRMSRTGNSAFDAHRAKVMGDLEEERRAFAAHRAEERRKRDQDAFEAFQTERNQANQAPEDESKP
jgi:Protein of unknown function (DUF2852)